MLKSPDWEARVEAVRQLRQYQDHDPRAFSGIVEALYDPEREDVSYEAMDALMDLQTPEAADALLVALRSDNEEIADYVGMWLQFSDSPWAKEILARDT
jgi:HEAT repeat protein